MTKTRVLKAPFPYFGGKSTVAKIVWDRFGDVPNYVEPFCGSAAMLLGRPHTPHTETINDASGFIANFWRAVKLAPEEVADWVDWPVNENDLSARHIWLVNNSTDLKDRLEGDPEYYDAKIAGWWCWGACSWIGSGWCEGKGPWKSVDGIMTKLDTGKGINRKRPHLSGAMGINRQLPHLSGGGGQCEEWNKHLHTMMQQLCDRLRCVRVCCGDWSRVCTPTPMTCQGLTAVFLDPPYSQSERRTNLYETEMKCSKAVLDWAIQHGDDKLMRICFCGYEGEHTRPDGWEEVKWKTSGGYGVSSDGRGQANAPKERLWFSPHCLKSKQDSPLSLFDTDV